jgi:hypothetical protein
MNNHINPTGDTPSEQCITCGWWVSSLIRVSGRLRIFDEQRQEVPQAFYVNFNGERYEE